MTGNNRDDFGKRQQSEDTSLGRRSYLKTAASVAAATAVGAAGAAANQSDDEYDVITVPAGSKRTIWVNSNETFENTLIDITASEAKFEIIADGSDWAIRNVGIRGVWDSFDNDGMISARVDDGSTGVIENIYWADGAIDDEYPGVSGILVPHTHAGTLKIDRINIQGLPDNAVYASGPGQTDEYGHDGGYGGEVHITNSYAADCRATHFRLGSTGSYVKNCVAVRGDRGFFGRFEDTKAIDSTFVNARFADIAVGAHDWYKEASTHATVTAENCHWESVHLTYDTNELIGEPNGNPQTDPPAGVPLTPEEAASGGSSSGGDLSRTITIRDDRSFDEAANYEFTVSGDLEKSNGDGATINADDSVDGSTATGHVWGGTDSYAFSGDLTDFQVDRDVTVLVDGTEHDASDLMCNHSNVVTVDGTNGKTQYELTASDGLEKSVDEGATIDDHDTVDGTSASGHVWGWKDSYRFAGDLTALDLKGPGNVYVNGTQVDPDQY